MAKNSSRALPFLIVLFCFAESIELYPVSSSASILQGDQVLGVVDLPVNLVFYRNSYNVVRVCKDGLISLNGRDPCVKATISRIPYSQFKVIGLFIADVDIAASGVVSYEHSTEPALLQRAKRDIVFAYGDYKFKPTLLVIATYKDVGCCQNSAELNTYQVVVATDGSVSYALFLYVSVKWASWTLGPRTRTAHVRFDNGDNTNYLALNLDISDLVSLPLLSNVKVPGLFVYKISDETIPAEPETALYPFDLRAGDDVLAAADQSSTLIPLAQSLRLYGSVYNSVYVNTDGFISAANLGGGASNPTGFPTSNGLFIAPFWADVDTTCAGTVFYRETNNASLLLRATDEIKRAYAAVGFSPVRLLIVTWAGVGYYNCHADKTNTFQVVIASSGSASFVLFIYDGIRWLNGDSSGTAHAGISAGDGTNYFALYGTGTSSLLNLPIQSNVAKRGLFVLGETSKLYPFGSDVEDSTGTGRVSPPINFTLPYYYIHPISSYVYRSGYLSFGYNTIGTDLPRSEMLGASYNACIVAPYWADVDITNGGNYYYRTTASEPLLRRVSWEVQSSFSVNFVPTRLLVATWDHVASSTSVAKRNTFQAIVATNGLVSYIIFLYDELQWTQSDVVRQDSPQVGYAIYTKHNVLPVSGSSDALSLTTGTNAHVPGVFLFGLPVSFKLLLKQSHDKELIYSILRRWKDKQQMVRKRTGKKRINTSSKSKLFPDHIESLTSALEFELQQN